MPRNNKKVIQTSLYLATSWRANVDFQILLIPSDDGIVSIKDIARLTDYIVSYMCKGNETQIQEKKNMTNVIMESVPNTGDIKDVKQMAHCVLNHVLKDWIISHQECLCQLASLPLYLCSEDVNHVSISGHVKLGKQNENKSGFLAKYQNRDSQFKMLSLHQYFYHTKENQKKQRKNQKTAFPNYTGGRIEMTYPLNPSLARSLLLIHKPWQKTIPTFGNTENTIIQQCTAFLQSTLCPTGVKYLYEKEKARYESEKKCRTIKHT